MSWRAKLGRIFHDKAVAPTAVSTSAEDIDYEQLYVTLDPKRKQIRVLEVQPGEGSAPVRGTLRPVSLLDEPKPQYETISYVWGDSTNHGTVYLSQRAKVVPASAEAVLRRVRLRDQSRVVWIDSICIDQSNLAERSQQVALMGEVYAGGARNLIWLGEDDGFTGAALSDINKVLEDMKAETNDFRDIVTVLYDRSGNLVRSNTPGNCGIMDIGPLRAFFSSPWFSRLWIVQEAALAVENVCYRGDYEFPLEDASTAAVWIFHKNDLLLPVRHNVYLAQFADRRCGSYAVGAYQSFNILSIFLLLRSFTATDPRDHIYGCLGLIQRFVVDKPVARTVSPDYEASLAEVYSNATKSGIMDVGQVEVLLQVSHREGDDQQDVPSWVPRWDRIFDSRKDAIALLSHADRLAHNGEFFDSTLLEGTDAMTLPVKGLTVGSITRITPVFYLHRKKGENWARQCLNLLDYATQFARTDIEPDNHHIVDSELPATLVASIDERGPTPLNQEECEKKYAVFVKYLREGDVPPWDRSSSGVRTDDEITARGFWETFSWACNHRRLFCTASGLLGLGPATMKVDDVAVVLHGSGIPFVLRPWRESAKSTHQLVGHCYVHRIMKGEAVKQYRSEGKEDEVFYLG